MAQETSDLTVQMPVGEKLSLRRVRFSPPSHQKNHAPGFAIVSGIHGDELEGFYVCYLIEKKIKAIRKKNPEWIKDAIDLYPSANPLGADTMNRYWPYFQEDMNRKFPGKQHGTPPSRTAYALLDSLIGARMVIDIHSSNIFLREVPQVRMLKKFQKILLPQAQALGVSLIWIHGASTVLETTISYHLNHQKTPTLVVEMGVGLRVTQPWCEELAQGILRLLVLNGALDPQAIEKSEAKTKALLTDDSNVIYLNAAASGLFIAKTEVGKHLEKGDKIGEIVDMFGGKILEKISMPHAGYLFTLREYPLVYEGSLIARIRSGNPQRIK